MDTSVVVTVGFTVAAMIGMGFLFAVSLKKQ